MPLHVAVGAAGNEQGTELAKLFIINQTWCFANYKVTRHTHSDAHSTHTRSQAHSLTHTHTLAHTLTPSVRCCVACNSSGSDARAADSCKAYTGSHRAVHTRRRTERCSEKTSRELHLVTANHALPSVRDTADTGMLY